MYGWRARIGAIVPSTNTVVEPEFWRMVPDGVSVHAARMYVETRATTDELRAMTTHSYRAARELMSAHVGAIVYACTSGSFIEGSGWEAEFERRALAETGTTDSVQAHGSWKGEGPALLGQVLRTRGLRVLTTFQAVVTALNVLKARRIAVATAYPTFLNEALQASLTERGFEVLAITGLGLENPLEIGVVTPEVPYNLARRVFTREADAVFISCTNLRTIDVIRILEHELGVPVVSSNQASFWLALRLLGINDALPIWGRLLEMPLDDALPDHNRGSTDIAGLART